MKNVFKMKADGSFLTPEFRVSFPKIFQADEFGKYGLAMLFPKETTDMKLLDAAIQTLIKEKYPKGAPKNFMMPVHDGDESDREEKIGQWVINAKGGKYRPGLVDKNNTDITEESEFYPGCWARATITLYAWENKQKGTKGISIGVRNIQKLRDDGPLISRTKAADEFEPVNDATVEDM